MAKRYLLYKFCRNGEHHLITWLTASGLDEANLAVKLLRKNHPQHEDLALGDGEFFEIVEEAKLKPGEWEEAMQILNQRESGLQPAAAKDRNTD